MKSRFARIAGASLCAAAVFTFAACGGDGGAGGADSSAPPAPHVPDTGDTSTPGFFMPDDTFDSLTVDTDTGLIFDDDPVVTDRERDSGVSDGEDITPSTERAEPDDTTENDRPGGETPVTREADSGRQPDPLAETAEKDSTDNEDTAADPIDSLWDDLLNEAGEGGRIVLPLDP